MRGCGSVPDFTALAPLVADPAERVLLEQAQALWALLEATPPEDRGEIAWVLEEILRGQKLDLTRFGQGAPGEIRALATAQELEGYTYSVAGCVGSSGRAFATAIFGITRRGSAWRNSQNSGARSARGFNW